MFRTGVGLAVEDTGQYYESSTGKAITTNLDGEFIFIDEEYYSLDMPEYLDSYLNQHIFKRNIPEFSRLTYPKIKEFIIGEAAAGEELAKQVLDYFAILERSIDWELTIQPYHFNEIPSFPKEDLRVHNDLILKIAEYEIYHKDENTYDSGVAHRFANEQVGNMYGLFNYLALDHGYV